MLTYVKIPVIGDRNQLMFNMTVYYVPSRFI